MVLRTTTNHENSRNVPFENKGGYSYFIRNKQRASRSLPHPKLSVNSALQPLCPLRQAFDFVFVLFSPCLALSNYLPLASAPRNTKHVELAFAIARPFSSVTSHST